MTTDIRGSERFTGLYGKLMDNNFDLLYGLQAKDIGKSRMLYKT
jgi:hypothetical protein